MALHSPSVCILPVSVNIEYSIYKCGKHSLVVAGSSLATNCLNYSKLGLLTVNRLTGYPVLKGWTGYKLSGPRNRSDLALIVRLLQQMCRQCRRHKVTSDDLDHTHTHYNLLRPTSVEWVDHTLCGPHTAALRLPLSVSLSHARSMRPLTLAASGLDISHPSRRRCRWWGGGRRRDP